MPKLQVQIPKYSIPEVEYTFKCLLKVFMGIEFQTTISDNIDFFVIQQGQKQISIRNSFFKTDNLEELYNVNRIPHAVNNSTISIGNQNLPLVTLFGQTDYKIQNNHFLLESDIISSTFFMLSRWEEYVIDNKDSFNRFDHNCALSVKFCFYQRPVVNEYVELLWALLKFMNFTVNRKFHSYQPIATFDIDKTIKWQNVKSLMISIKKNTFNLKVNWAIKDIKSYIMSTYNKAPDPYSPFDYIIRSITHRHILGIFYFKTSSSTSKYDRNKYDIYSKSIQKVFQKIWDNKMQIGVHPGYLTFDDYAQMKYEIKLLQDALETKLKHVRQHYLRFKLPLTWQIQTNCGLDNDSSMLYPHMAGFRNGVCYTFPVFDIINRSILPLSESPLLFMETSYLKQPKCIPNEINKITNQVKKYHGQNIILWHNSNLFYQQHIDLFEQTLDIISEDA